MQIKTNTFEKEIRSFSSASLKRRNRTLFSFLNEHIIRIYPTPPPQAEFDSWTIFKAGLNSAFPILLDQLPF